MNKKRALVVNGTSVFFCQADNRYRYWYRRSTQQKAGRLVIQIKAKDLEEFRKTLKGRAYEEVVDIFSIGGGWYEVTSDDFSNYDSRYHLTHDGIKPWLKAFNAYFNPQSIDNTNMVVMKVMRGTPDAPLIKHDTGRIARVRTVSPGSLQALVNHFN